jgi:hypothetical protein
VQNDAADDDNGKAQRNREQKELHRAERACRKESAREG